MATKQQAAPRRPVEEDCDVEEVIRAQEREESFKTKFAPKEPKDFWIRILPPVPAADPTEKRTYYVEFAMHYDLALAGIKTPDPDMRGLACLRPFGQDCPLCEFQQQLRVDMIRGDGSKDEGLDKIQYGMRSQKRVVMNVLNLNQPGEVLTWELSGNLHTEHVRCLFTVYKNPTIVNSARGRNIRVKYTKPGKMCFLGSVQVGQEESAIDETKWPNWRSQRHDLQAYIRGAVLPQAKLAELVAGSKLNTLSGAKPATAAPAAAAASVAHQEAVAAEPEHVEDVLDDDPAAAGPDLDTDGDATNGIAEDAGDAPTGDDAAAAETEADDEPAGLTPELKAVLAKLPADQQKALKELPLAMQVQVLNAQALLQKGGGGGGKRGAAAAAGK